MRGKWSVLVLVGALAWSASAVVPMAPEVRDVPSTLALKEPLVLHEFDGLPDPAAWSVDGVSGLHYRRATAQERAEHGWDVGTFLAEGRVPLGAASHRLLLPRTDATATLLEVRLRSADPGTPAGAVYADGHERQFTPLVLRYESSPLDPSTGFEELLTAHAAGAQLTIDSEGGLYGHAILEGVSGELLGGDARWRLDAVPGFDAGQASPGHLVLVRLAPLLVPQGFEPRDHCGVLQIICDLIGNRDQCDNGRDDDGDRWVDHPSDPGCSGRHDNNEFDSRFTEKFSLHGDGRWCTRNQPNWVSLVNGMGGDIEAAYDGHGTTRADAQHVFSTCLFFSSLSIAEQCDAGTLTCYYESDRHPYEYQGCRNDGPCYRDRLWGMVAHLRGHFNWDPVNFAQALTDRVMSGGTLCGIASFSGNGPNYDPGSSGPLPSGDSVSVGNPHPSNCVDFIPSHETGHNFDAVHSDADLIAGCWTVMAAGDATPACRHDYFSDRNRAHVNDCVGNRGSGCPRAGTG